MSEGDNAAQLQEAFSAVVRAMGLLRPDTTPCGQRMSLTEAHALTELHDHGPLTQQALATALGLEKSTISRLVDQLEAADLARRTANPGDRRSVLVGLTAPGTERAERLRAARRSLFAELLARLDPADRPTVLAGLTRLEEAARADHP